MEDHALRFAHLVAEVDPSDISTLLRDTFSAPNIRTWYHLMRILFGHWFRNSTLLKKSYLQRLKLVKIQCSSGSIPWTIFNKAARRLRVANPSPYYLVEVVLKEDCSEDLFEDVVSADCQWIKASVEFYLDRRRLRARLF